MSEKESFKAPESLTKVQILAYISELILSEEIPYSIPHNNLHLHPLTLSKSSVCC